MISAMDSHSGKTAICSSLITALKKRNLKVAAFKTGPDYIDPMYHSIAAAKVCINLVPYFLETDFKKDELPELALEIFNDLKYDFTVTYDEKDAIGRRYRRQDAVGTPFCVTVDHQTKEDNTVTIRHRDTMEQQRVPIASLKDIIFKEVDMNQWLRKISK